MTMKRIMTINQTSNKEDNEEEARAQQFDVQSEFGTSVNLPDTPVTSDWSDDVEVNDDDAIEDGQIEEEEEEKDENKEEQKTHSNRRQARTRNRENLDESRATDLQERAIYVELRLCLHASTCIMSDIIMNTLDFEIN